MTTLQGDAGLPGRPGKAQGLGQVVSIPEISTDISAILCFAMVWN